LLKAKANRTTWKERKQNKKKKETDLWECKHSPKTAKYKEKSCWETLDNKNKKLNIPHSDWTLTQTQPKAAVLDSDDRKPKSKKKTTIRRRRGHPLKRVTQGS